MTQRGFWIGLGIAFLVVFAPMLRHGFILLDDDEHLFNNPSMLRPSIESTLEYWKKPYFGMYIPVTYTVWAVEAGFAKPAKAEGNPPLYPWVFHLGNIVFHALNVLLIARIGFLLFGTGWAAVIGAALFALHPVQVETVSWAAGRRDLLSFFFALIAMWQLLEGCRPNFRWAKHFGIATFFYSLALLSKPSAASLCAMAPLMLWGWDKKKVKDLALLFAAWGVLAFPVFWITRNLQPLSMLTFIPSLPERPLIAADALWFYVRQIAVPWNLAIDYARDPKWVLDNKAWMTGVAGVSALVIAAIVLKANKKIWAIAGIFVASLLPVSGILSFAFQQYTTVADHYAYSAMFACALGLGLVISTRQEEWVRMAGAVAVGLFAARAFFYVPIWSDSPTMFVHTLSLFPRSQIANNNLGYLREKEGNLKEALALYRKGLELRPNWADARYNVGNILAKLGEFAEAERMLRAALEKNPKHADSHHVIGGIYMNTGHYVESLTEFESAIKIRPDVATYHSKKASALTYLKRYDEALVSFQAAIRLNPMLGEAYNNQGVTLQRMGRKAEAMDSFATAVNLNDSYIPAKANLATLLANEQRCKEALPIFSSIVKQIGETDELRSHVANCLAQVGQYTHALEIYEMVLKSNPKDPDLKNRITKLRRQIASAGKNGTANAKR
jgi:protein O-mannosyl-transferase